MNKYKRNLKALDNLRSTNKRITEIEIILEKKYQFNKKQMDDVEKLLNDSMNKYTNIIKNLDGFLS